MKNRHILILSANTGEGHNSAARAIADAFEAEGCSCLLQDGLAFLPAYINRIICKSHIFFYRWLPKIYSAAYRLAEILSRNISKGKKPARSRLSGSEKRLLAFLEKNDFDAVICTHVFAAQMISRLRIAKKTVLPAYFLATDYSCSPGVSTIDVDAWFIPHEKLIPEFACRGIPEEKIRVTGIPVCGEFLIKSNKYALRRKLNLPEKSRIVCLSCGSMGAGNMEKLTAAILKKLPADALLVVLCGSNHALRNRLNRRIRSEKMLALGFVVSLAEYMAASDIYLTKPGGLSSTEALHTGVYTIFFNAVSGVESGNLRFMMDLGYAGTGNTAMLANLVQQTLSDDNFNRTFSAEDKKIFDGCAAERIKRYILEKELFQ